MKHVFIEILKCFRIQTIHFDFNIIAFTNLQLLWLQHLLLSYLACDRIKVEILRISWLLISIQFESVLFLQLESVASQNRNVNSQY